MGANNLTIGLIGQPLEWELWTAARDMLDPALAHSDETWPEVEARLASSHDQLWAVIDGDELVASAITRLIPGRLGEVAEIFICGGRGFRRWASALTETIIAAAQDKGCTAVRCFGRKGWAPTLAPLGFKESFVTFEKAL